ncbi:MAG: cytochrome C assembly family protein [Pseudohongiellaceae bacterium]
MQLFQLTEQLTIAAGLLAILCYLAGAVLQGMSVARGREARSMVLLFGGLAVLAHAVSAWGVIHSSRGFQFGIAEISTFIAVAISLLVLISSLHKPLENLFLGLFPLAIVSILASLTLSSSYPPTQLDSGLASHVLISVLAYSFFTIAAFQAMFLAYQNHQLKTAHAGGVLGRLPSLQDMEALLFELVWTGQVLLSLGIVAGFIFVDDLWSRDGIIHKTFFSLLAWLVFSVLLWGRHQAGWRGPTAVRYTLSGFGLLIVGFYGSKFALEYVFS